MPGPAETAVVTIEIFSACTWVGGMVCLAVVSNAARHVLEPRSQIAFFRTIGRRYGIVGTVSLLIAIGAGLWLVWPPGAWSGVVIAAVALAGVLVAASVAGMAQARAMTRLRRRAVESPGDERAAQAVRRGRVVATSLRGTMALCTAAIVVLAAEIVTS